MGMTKVTIILFYIRLCHVYTRFCQACWVVIVIVCLNTIIFMFLNIFQCTPINWNWNRFSGNDMDFQCMDLNKLQWSINITNIIFDVVVLALPIPLVWRSTYFVLLGRNLLTHSSEVDIPPKTRHHLHVQLGRRCFSRQLPQNAIQHSLRSLHQHNMGLHGPHGLGRHRKLREHRSAVPSHCTIIPAQSVPTVFRPYVCLWVTRRPYS